MSRANSMVPIHQIPMLSGVTSITVISTYCSSATSKLLEDHKVDGAWRFIEHDESSRLISVSELEEEAALHARGKRLDYDTDLRQQRAALTGP